MYEEDIKFFDSILEYYIYQDYKLHYLHPDYDESFFYPTIFYRYNELKETYFYRENLELKNHSQLADNEQVQLENIIKNIKSGDFDFKSFILYFKPKYTFLFGDSGEMENPERLTQEEEKKLRSLVLQGDSDLFLLQAFATLEAHHGFENISPYFEKILELDPHNPFYLARFSRYVGSNLRENNNYEYSEKLLKQSLDEFSKNGPPPIFIYGRFGYLYHLTEEYTKAEENFLKCIQLYAKIGRVEIEPIFALAKTYSRMKRFQDSYNLIKDFLAVSWGPIPINLSLYAFVSEVCFLNRDFYNFEKYFNIGLDFFIHHNSAYLQISGKVMSFKEFLKLSIHEGDTIDSQQRIRNMIALNLLYKQSVDNKNIQFINTKGFEKLNYIFLLKMREGRDYHKDFELLKNVLYASK